MDPHELFEMLDNRDYYFEEANLFISAYLSVSIRVTPNLIDQIKRNLQNEKAMTSGMILSDGNLVFEIPPYSVDTESSKRKQTWIIEL